MAKLGFIGTGTIGHPIAGRLLGAGHELVVTDVSRAATANLEERGARRVDSPRVVAQECAVVFGAFAANVFYLGESGRSTIAKLANNLIFLAGALVVQEAFVLAAKAGLGARELLPIVNASSAKLYAGMAPLFFGRNFEMALFKLGIAEKDVAALALVSARELGSPLPLCEAASQTYQRAVDEGHTDQAFFATLQTLERAAGVEVEKLG